MAAPYPQLLPKAFALNAAGPDRNTIPDAPLTTQRASFNLGFPPLTMTPVVAGGKPMLGPDMNGILYMLSTHNYYQQSGKLYQYNADVVVAIGGYAIGTLLGSTDGNTVWYCTAPNNSNDPDAVLLGWIALYSYGITTIPGLNGGGGFTLTPAQSSKSVIVLSGTLVANQQIWLPAQYRRWLIVNACTGAFALTVKTQAGSGVNIPQGGFSAPVEVWCDGTNIYNVVAPVNLPIDVSPTPGTIVQRSNVGDVFARYYNTGNTLENAGISALYFEFNGDGYIRKMTLANVQAQMVLSSFAGQVSNAQVPQSAVTQHSAALFSSPALTDVPTAPTAAIGTNSAQVATTAFVRDQTLGNGQSWSDVSGSRGLGVNYTNTTGRPIEVAFSGKCRRSSAGGGTFQALCNAVPVGALLAAGSTDMDAAISFTVPPGGVYSVSQSGASNGYVWSELR